MLDGRCIGVGMHSLLVQYLQKIGFEREMVESLRLMREHNDDTTDKPILNYLFVLSWFHDVRLIDRLSYWAHDCDEMLMRKSRQATKNFLSGTFLNSLQFLCINVRMPMF